LVLSMLGDEPRGAGGVARELARAGVGREQPAHLAATVTLGRLQHAGLVYASGAARTQPVFRITARGCRELALQRALARL
jgi:DNA-binding PadR family transcriptional regulator